MAGMPAIQLAAWLEFECVSHLTLVMGTSLLAFQPDLICFIKSEYGTATHSAHSAQLNGEEKKLIDPPRRVHIILNGTLFFLRRTTKIY